jgi:ElaB/YqjD/DUF883 family membrane-anchored ribosome-binding protein
LSPSETPFCGTGAATADRSFADNAVGCGARSCRSLSDPVQLTVEQEHQSMGDTQRQINQLRGQVETLMRERLTPAITEVAGRADTAVSALREQSEAVSGQVRERPLLAILIAAGIGYLLGRFLSP